jgi:hypothetical protein
VPAAGAIIKTAAKLLKQIQALFGNLTLAFPRDHSLHNSISENTINKALGAMDFDTQKDIHGHEFRAIA